MSRINKTLIGFLCLVIGSVIYMDLDLTCMNSCMGCGDSFLMLYFLISIILMMAGLWLLFSWVLFDD